MQYKYSVLTLMDTFIHFLVIVQLCKQYIKLDKTRSYLSQKEFFLKEI